MYAMAFGACWVCKQPFSFNPKWVPSIRVRGEREPICLKCVALCNPIRERHGLAPIVPHPEAYEPCDESELGE